MRQFIQVHFKLSYYFLLPNFLNFNDFCSQALPCWRLIALFYFDITIVTTAPTKDTNSKQQNYVQFEQVPTSTITSSSCQTLQSQKSYPRSHCFHLLDRRPC